MQDKHESLMDGELASLRGQLDDVDGELVRLLNRRAALSVDVGNCKRRQGETVVFRPERERKILDRLAEVNRKLGGLFPESDIERIWQVIFDSSRAMQRQRLK
jgi:chorismate mutase/prephenate dehydratase